MIKCVILDFDGTFTDVEKEGAPFTEAFRAQVGDLLGRNVDDDWARLTVEVDGKPDVYGWEYEGKIVAPANADPYIRATTVAGRLFNEMGVLRDAQTRAEIVHALYHLAYRRSGTAFRDDARDVLSSLASTDVPVVVVTNASTEVVTRKLAELAPRGLERIEVIGDARKYAVVDPKRHDGRFDLVPAELHLPGLARPIAPRRGHYFDVLAGVAARTGVEMRDMLVCGDIFELDLVMPAELGMHVHLVSGPHTPAYELAALAQLAPRATVGKLDDVLGRLEG